jgi:hypothetical protein
LASDPERLKERIHFLFVLAKASVDEELNGTNAPTSNGHSANGNGHRRSAGRRATASQVRALHAIADRQKLDLAGALQERFTVSQAEDLSITEASELIDSLKGAGNGAGGGR